jgi:hypothetical protein
MPIPATRDQSEGCTDTSCLVVLLPQNPASQSVCKPDYESTNVPPPSGAVRGGARAIPGGKRRPTRARAGQSAAASLDWLSARGRRGGRSSNGTALNHEVATGSRFSPSQDLGPDVSKVSQTCRSQPRERDEAIGPGCKPRSPPLSIEALSRDADPGQRPPPTELEGRGSESPSFDYRPAQPPTARPREGS